ncbi:MAG: phBC6A51 family helix-turn-helix protein [Oscillospiraceae bacterium]
MQKNKNDENPLSLAQMKAAQILLESENKTSMKAVAEALNVSAQTIYRWLKNADFNRYLEELVEQQMLESEASIWKTLLGRCRAGDLSAIKLYFDLRTKNRSREQNEEQTPVQIIDDVPNISFEEIKKFYGTLAGEMISNQADFNENVEESSTK